MISCAVRLRIWHLRTWLTRMQLNSRIRMNKTQQVIEVFVSSRCLHSSDSKPYGSGCMSFCSSDKSHPLNLMAITKYWRRAGYYVLVLVQLSDSSFDF